MDESGTGGGMFKRMLTNKMATALFSRYEDKVADEYQITGY